ncbi:hypothetical protein [Natronobeatus ordinarius]|uniref:hypothetical protein n=1 Tax=Natronobeatus ordinarius TaxID=2963433 RepID=UPI0020CE7C55|nr:hypothetical protein [Natronobeatus ordinarius]
MDNELENDPSSESFPTCPNCGMPVVDVTITGPTTQYARPCGCLVHLSELE